MELVARGKRILHHHAVSLSKENTEYDFILIGAGPSASGILHALQEQEDATFRVAIIERGEAVRNAHPLDSWCLDAFWNPDLATVYHSSNENRQSVRIGRGLGGSSLINAGLVIPPTAEDVNDWDFCSVDEFEDALKVVQASLHRTLAPKSTSSRVHCSSAAEVAADGFLSYNSFYQRVPHAMDAATGRRVSYFESLVTIKDERLSLFTGWTAEEILWDDRAVRIRKNETVDTTSAVQVLSARYDVILCCGAIETPALLHASGFQPKNLHSTYTINDHIGLPRVYLTWPRFRTLRGLHSIATFRSKQQQQQVIDDKNLTFQVMVYDSGSPALCDLAPTIAALLFPKAYFNLVATLLHYAIQWTPLYWIMRYCCTIVNVFVLHTAAPVGTISFQKSRMDLRLHYPPSQRDVEKLQSAWKLSKQYVQVDGLEIFPMLGCPNMFCRSACLSYYHWMGTCKDILFDRKTLSVRPGVRICDASVLPRTTSGPPALTCATMGYVLGKSLLLRESASRDQGHVKTT